MCGDGGINKPTVIKASTGCVQGMTSCDPCSPCVQLVAATIFGQGEQKFHIICTLGSESSRERKLQGAKVPPMELSLLGAKVRENESSSYR